MSAIRSGGATLLAVSALALLGSVAAPARAAEPPQFTLQGYGTLGLVHSSETRADFLGGLLVEHGAGHSQSWSPEVDSRLGAQLTATLSPRLTAVIQLLAEQQADGSYTPHVEWANLKVQLSPDLSLRVGRIVLPTFMVSDFRKVGYSNPWVRPPVELYGLIPVTANDGVDANFRATLGKVTGTIQGNFGQSDTELPDGGQAEARSAWGFTVTGEGGGATLRAGVQQASLRLTSFNTLFDAFRRFGPEGEAIADRFDVDGTTLTFAGVGAQYDPGDWFVMAEAGRIRSESALGDRTAWYVSAGYRFGDFTPYAAFSAVDLDSAASDPGLTASAYPPELRQTALGLNAALAGILGSRPVQENLSLGARWDFRRNFDLKVQFDRSRPDAASTGALGNVQPGFTPGRSYELISVALDFVF